MQGKPIEHFMWQWQHLFRSNVDTEISDSLRAIGLEVDAQGYLVGFAATPDARWPWCIEPEDQAIAQADLSRVAARAADIYRDDPESSVWNTDPRTHENRQLALRNRARASALAEALRASPFGADRLFFAGFGRRIGDYDVYPVVSVLAAAWNQTYALATCIRERTKVDRSLQHAVVDAVLRAASMELDRPDPEWFERDRSELLRKAADHLTYSTAVLSGQLMAQGLLESMDAVAAQPYEGRNGIGTVILAASSSDAVERVVSFSAPTAIGRVRAFRKVLEMSGPNLHVLTDGRQIYGLGRVHADYDPATERVFELRVVGRGSWELRHDGNPLMRVDNSRPILPKPKLSAGDFADTAGRLFAEQTDDDTARLWRLTEAASVQAHGTMLVVHDDAGGEASRLEPQSLRMAPTHLEPSSLSALTNIDGAILLSPDGRCHAAGVILDGVATGTGDASRGARYNSAVRYLRSTTGSCLIIIVSEDGMIDLLPKLRRRVDRTKVADLVDNHEAASHPPTNFETFFRLDHKLVEMSFYLDTDQCARANASRERVEQQRGGNITIVHGELTPNPEMDESYFR